MELLYEKVLDDLLLNQEKLTKTELINVFVTLSNYIFPKTKSVRDKFIMEKLKLNKDDFFWLRPKPYQITSACVTNKSTSASLF